MLLCIFGLNIRTLVVRTEGEVGALVDDDWLVAAELGFNPDDSATVRIEADEDLVVFLGEWWWWWWWWWWCSSADFLAADEEDDPPLFRDDFWLDKAEVSLAKACDAAAAAACEAAATRAEVEVEVFWGAVDDRDVLEMVGGRAPGGAAAVEDVGDATLKIRLRQFT